MDRWSQERLKVDLVGQVDQQDQRGREGPRAQGGRQGQRDCWIQGDHFRQEEDEAESAAGWRQGL